MAGAPVIGGLLYVPEYLDREAHDALLAAVDLHPWRTSMDRRVQVYGYTYHHPTRSVFRVEDLPRWASALASRLCADGLVPTVPDQLVVNDYSPGSGIFAHVDQAVFGDTVISISLGSSCVMQFSKVDGKDVEEFFLQPRSALVLTGDARWQWQHGIPARAIDIWQQREHPRSRRVSLTFRMIPAAGVD